MGPIFAVTVPMCIAAAVLLPLVCAALVLMRFVSRRSQKLAIGLDDWLTLPALALVMGMGVAALIGAVHELNNKEALTSIVEAPAEDIHEIRLEPLQPVFWSIEIMQTLALGLVNLSVILFLRRIFDHGNCAVFRLFSTALMALIVGWTVAFFFVFACICAGRPGAYWNPAEQQQFCLDTRVVHAIYGISDVVISIVVLLTPVPLVLRLQMSGMRKGASLAVFALASLSVVASVLRMVTYLHFEDGASHALIIDAIYFSLLEAGIALMCACLPTLQNFVRHQIADAAKRSRDRRHTGTSARWSFQHQAWRKSVMSPDAPQDEWDGVQLSFAEFLSVTKVEGGKLVDPTHPRDSIIKQTVIETISEPSTSPSLSSEKDFKDVSLC